MTDRERQLLLKLLKALPRSGATLDAERPTTTGALVLVAANGRIRVAAAILALAARQGLIERVESRIRPMPAAAGFCARHEAPGEPDFARPHRVLAPDTVTRDGAREQVVRNLAESPLSVLERLKGRSGEAYFPREAVAAGERLHGDFTRGQLQPQITMRFEPRLGTAVKGARGAVADLSDTALAARSRVNRAVEALGPELAGVALDVCCFLKGLETVERERQWPARSAKLMLKTALLALHRHYTPPPRPRTRHWGDDGYRPDLA